MDEKGKPSGAFTIHKEATKTLNALALRLRVSPQARPQKAPKSRDAAGRAITRGWSLKGCSDDDDARERDQ